MNSDMMEIESEQCFVDILPDQVWRLVFELLALNDASNTSIVCKAWHRLVWASRYEISIPFKKRALFNDENLIFLANHSQNKILHLDLSGVDTITDTGIKFLAEGCTNLRSLTLSWSRSLTDASLEEIGSNLGELRLLDISWCQKLSDNGIKRLVECAAAKQPSLIKNLEILIMSWSYEITGQSAKMLSSFGNLKSVLLHGCEKWPIENITELVNSLPKLSQLGLNWCAQVRQEDLDEFKETRPTLEIEHLCLAEQSAQAIPSMAAKLNSPRFSELMESVTAFRRILSMERNPPIDDVIRAGVVPMLVKLLEHTDTMVQMESAWALTNIASGTSEHTRVVAESGAVPVFIQLMRSPDMSVRDQAIWTLGNIAGDSAALRDYVLSCGVLDPLLANLTEDNKLSVLRNGTWCFSNLTRGKPRPDFKSLIPSFPVLKKLLSYKDEEVLVDACWATSFLTDNALDIELDEILKVGMLDPITAILKNETASWSLITPCLRFVGNVASGNDEQTQELLNHGVLPSLARLLGSTKRSIRKEACWTISNITAGHDGHIQAVIDAALIPPIVNLLGSGSSPDIRKEACWVVANATTGGNSGQLAYLVVQGVIPPLVDLLSSADARIVIVALEALENLSAHPWAVKQMKSEESLEDNFANLRNNSTDPQVLSKLAIIKDRLVVEQ